MYKPYVLLILDGIGVDVPSKSNPVALADKYNLDNLVNNYFTTTLYAHGEHVGLPLGVPGNSEVGHLNIGAGKIIHQDISRINNAIKDKSFFVNKYFIEAILSAQKNKKKLHLIGTLSYSPENSYIEHFYSLIELVKSENLKDFYVHIILDGEDFSNNSGIDLVNELQERLNIMGLGKIASISGRKYGMDRNLDWENTEKAYNAIVLGKADRCYNDPVKAIQESYDNGEFDNEVIPTVIIDKNKKPVATVDSGDSVIFFNFKQDKIRQLAKSIIEDDFDEFEDRKELKDMIFVTMTEYEKHLNCNIAFEDENIENTLVSVLSNNNINQLHISETEKYPYVTFFLNGKKDEIAKGEERVLVPSQSVVSKDLKPEMKVFKISRDIVDYINEEKYGFIVANFANAEIMAHAGEVKKTVKAVQAIDRAVKEVVDAVLNRNGVVFIVGDHGNAEKMFIDDVKYVDHSANPVPFIIVGNDFQDRRTFANFNILSSVEPTGRLSDVAPTILKVMNLRKPEEMTGRELY